MMLTNRLFRFAIDQLNDRQVSGWAFHRLWRHKPVTLHFFLDDHPLGQVVANSFREDLKGQNIHASGCCGFSFTLPPQIDLDQYQTFAIRTGKAGKPLYVIDTGLIPRVFRGTVPKILFMHIPKTAGTSFNTFAQARFAPNEAQVHLEALDPALYPSLGAEKHYLAGHLRLQALEEHFDLAEFALYTILREPYSHLHSHLNWIRGVGAQPKSGFFARHPDCIQELGLRLNRTDRPVRETLAKLVSGLDGFELDFFDNLQTRYFLNYRPERVTADDLDQALENARRFAAIGLTEQYDHFLREFCTAQNCPYLPQEKGFNRSRHRRLYEPNDPDYQTLLRPLVHYDLQLYGAIRDRLSSRPPAR